MVALKNLKKIRRMRILGARIFFPSLLAVNSHIFKQMLTSWNYLKNRRMRILSAPYFSKFFGGEIGDI